MMGLHIHVGRRKQQTWKGWGERRLLFLVETRDFGVFPLVLSRQEFVARACHTPSAAFTCHSEVNAK